MSEILIDKRTPRTINSKSCITFPTIYHTGDNFTALRNIQHFYLFPNPASTTRSVKGREKNILHDFSDLRQTLEQFLNCNSLIILRRRPKKSPCKRQNKKRTCWVLFCGSLFRIKKPRKFSYPKSLQNLCYFESYFFFFKKEVKRHLEFLAKISQRSDSSWVFFLLPTLTLNITREKMGGLTATLAFFFGGLLVLGSELFLFFSGDFFFFSISFLSLGFSSCSDPEPLSEEDGSLSNLPTNNKLRPKNSCISLLHPPWLARVGNDFLDLPHLTEQCST